MGVKIREREGAWWLFIGYRRRRKAKCVCAIGSNRAESRRVACLVAKKVELRLASARKTLKANTARFDEMNLRLYITPVIGKMPLAG